MEYLQALVVLLLAIPFIYMAYDVSMELGKQLYRYTNLKLKPAVISLIQFTINK